LNEVVIFPSIGWLFRTLLHTGRSPWSGLFFFKRRKIVKLLTRKLTLFTSGISYVLKYDRVFVIKGSIAKPFLAG